MQLGHPVGGLHQGQPVSEALVDRLDLVKADAGAPLGLVGPGSIHPWGTWERIEPGSIVSRVTSWPDWTKVNR